MKITNKNIQFRNAIKDAILAKEQRKEEAELNRVNRLIEDYDNLKTIESLSGTLAIKAKAFGVNQFRYNYCRQVLRDYPNKEDFLKAVNDGTLTSIKSYKCSKRTKTSVQSAFGKALDYMGLDYKSPEVISFIVNTYNNIDKTLEHTTKLLRHTPCACCGKHQYSEFAILTTEDGVAFPICNDCFAEGKEPTEKALLKMLKNHNEVLEQTIREADDAAQKYFGVALNR